jgi:hypothetical protein
MPDLNVQTLSNSRLADAYPLIRSATRVTQQRWEEFGRELIAAGGGVVAVIAPDGCIHGVAAYRPRPNLRHRQSLDVEVFVAFELRGDNRVRQRLYSALERFGARLECETINLSTSAKDHDVTLSGSRRSLEKLGLKLETLNFVRALGSPEGEAQTRK